MVWVRPWRQVYKILANTYDIFFCRATLLLILTCSCSPSVAVYTIAKSIGWCAVCHLQLDLERNVQRLLVIRCVSLFTLGWTDLTWHLFRGMQCFDTNWEKMQCLLISHLHSAWVTRFSSLKETSLVCILFHAISPGIGGREFLKKESFYARTFWVLALNQSKNSWGRVCKFKYWK